MSKPHVYMCLGGHTRRMEVKVYFGSPSEEELSLTSALWQMAWILRFTDWLTQEVDRLFSEDPKPCSETESVSST